VDVEVVAGGPAVVEGSGFGGGGVGQVDDGAKAGPRPVMTMGGFCR
jgi:hypothetical protein